MRIGPRNYILSLANATTLALVPDRSCGIKTSFLTTVGLRNDRAEWFVKLGWFYRLYQSTLKTVTISAPATSGTDDLKTDVS
jgi:hypothetical protein